MNLCLTGAYLELVVLEALLLVYAALMLGTTAPLEFLDTLEDLELVELRLALVDTLEPSGSNFLCLSSRSVAGAGRDIASSPSVPVIHL